MGLLGVGGNLARFCNLDSQERLCELVEEPGFKSWSGKVNFPASCCPPSGGLAGMHPESPQEGMKQGEIHGPALWSRWL